MDKLKDMHHILAKNLKRIREQKGLTTKELAKLSGVNEKFIKGVEQESVKRIAFLKIWDLAKALDIKMEILFPI